MERLEHALKHSKTLGKSRASFIYLIGCHDFTKVGIADNPERRLMELQVGCPYQLKILATLATPNAVRDEAMLHAMWKRYEVLGEWFLLPAGELASAMNADDVSQVLGRK